MVQKSISIAWFPFKNWLQKNPKIAIFHYLITWWLICNEKVQDMNKLTVDNCRKYEQTKLGLHNISNDQDFQPGESGDFCSFKSISAELTSNSDLW
jgi:hypothetical protein